MIEDDYRVLLDLKKMYERRGVVATREVFKTEKGKGYIKVKQQRWFTKDGEERRGETYSAPGLFDLLKRTSDGAMALCGRTGLPTDCSIHAPPIWRRQARRNTRFSSGSGTPRPGTLSDTWAVYFPTWAMR